MKELFELYIVFFQIGAVCFGGGYAILPILQREVIEKRHWASDDEIMTYYAIGQCTPGVIAVNTSTFIGYQRKGILGGIIATFGFITPSIFIILIIASVMQNIMDYPIVLHVLGGIKVCVCALMIHSVIKLWKNAITDKMSLIIFVIVLILINVTELNSVMFVLISGVAGFLLGKLRRLKK